MTLALQNQRSRFRLPRRGWLPALMAGSITGTVNVGSGVAIAALLFAGPLAPGLGIGVGVVLLAAAVLAFGVALRSRLPNSLGLVQETSVAILAVALAAMAARMTAPAEAKVATALAIIGTASLTTGALFVLVGQLRLGGLARFLPYPVVAGFLAGSGWLLVEGALVMLTGENKLPAAVPHLADPQILQRVVLAVLFAGAMVLALRRFAHPVTAPIVLLAVALGFYAVLAALGLDVEEARALGHLPSVPGKGGTALPAPEMLKLVDWGEVLRAFPAILSAAALSIVGLLLSISGLEIAIGREIDADAELRSTGVANLVCGGFAGPSGFVDLGMTALAHRMGARDRRVGMITALFMVAGFAYALTIVAHMPVFLTAGFVLFLGVELVGRWFVASRRQLPLVEWLIVGGILAVVALIGFMEAIAVGLMVSITVFVYNYSKLPVVRLSTSGIEQRSSVDRSPAAMKFLARHADVIEVVQLQGYLFFGTADRMVNHVRRRLAATDARPLDYLVLDFRHVSGVDSAAITCFVKIKGLIDQHDVTVYFTHVPEHVRDALSKAGITFTETGRMRLEADIDHALERCEEELLAEHVDIEAEADLLKHLAAVVGAQPRLVDLVDAMEELHMQAEDVLIRAGDEPGDVYFVGRGRVRVQVTLPGGRILRLRTMTSGAVVGEIALYLGQNRTADVVVEAPSVIYGLSAERLLKLEREDPELAVLAHRLMASNLSEKLITANRMIQAAQR